MYESGKYDTVILVTPAMAQISFRKIKAVDFFHGLW